MENQIFILALILGIPFLAITVWVVSLMCTMRKTTGELKLWLTPDNTIKSIAIIFVTTSTLVLAVLNILDGAIAGAIFSGIIGYTLGIRLSDNKN